MPSRRAYFTYSVNLLIISCAHRRAFSRNFSLQIWPLPSTLLEPDRRVNMAFLDPAHRSREADLRVQLTGTPSQPLYPYQWPMPMPYNPYCGFPGLGYGMVMAPFPPNPYMEAPGYILPHAQLHLADYRRMVNPHFPPTVAYHARRFRYQQNGAPRETTNSEVQTETLLLSRSDSHNLDPCPGSDPPAGSDSGRGSSCTNASSPSQNPCPEKPECLNPESTPPPVPTCSAAHKTSYICRSEEVRIECEASPSGLKIIQSHETAAESSAVAAAAPSGDLVQCDTWSVSSAEGVIPLYRSSVHEGAVSSDPSCPTPEEQCITAFPDILMMGGSPSQDKDRDCAEPVTKPSASEPVDKMVIPSCRVELQEDCERDCDDHTANSTKLNFKILRLPFELQYLEDLRKLEESVWSVESLMPYVPSTEWMIQHGFMQPEKMVAEVPMETSSNHMEAIRSPETIQDMAVVQERDPRESTSSVDSLPPYVPSASWLADFGNVYYYSKLPLNVQERLSIMGTPADQLVAKKSSEKSNIQGVVAGPPVPLQKREGKHRRAQKLERERGKSTLVSGDERAQNCASCLTKPNVPACNKRTAGSTVKRHQAFPQPTSPPSSEDSSKLQTCPACNCSRGKTARKKRSPDVRKRNVAEQPRDEVEDEAVENRAHPVQPKPPGGDRGKVAENLAENGQKPAPSRRHTEACTAVQGSKLREQNCSCEVPQRGPSSEAQRRVHPDTTAKESSEFVAPAKPTAEILKSAGQRCLHQNPQTERTNKAFHDRQSCEIGSRQKNTSKPKKLSAPMQERQHCKTANKTGIQRPQNPDFVEPIEGHTASTWTKGMHRRDTRC
ncbi:hypothetical protein GJAV_G00069090 [Gymnothorax javanicus]|nr:hypothetical protein GJAV_G00069090 [Gymnothorax javanicus]